MSEQEREQDYKERVFWYEQVLTKHDCTTNTKYVQRTLRGLLTN